MRRGYRREEIGSSTSSISAKPGLGLPDRDYYWDAKFKTKLEAYQAYIERMLTLAKIGGETAKQAAADIVALETQIAKAQWSKVENRDVDKTYNKMGLAELAKLAPGFDWQLYFQTIGVKDAKEIVVAQPPYFTAMAELLDKVPLATWKVWLKFNIVRRYASLLNKELVDAEIRLLRHDPPRRSAKPPPLEAGRRRRGRLPGRGGGQAVRREAVPAGSQAADGPDGQERAGGLSHPLPEPGLDESRDQAEGPGETGHVHAQDRLSEEVARLFGPGDSPRRPGGQHRAGTRSTSGTATWPSLASRSIATNGT